MKISKIFRLPSQWTQGANARDKDGKAISFNAFFVGGDNNDLKNISSFSLQGAIAYFYSFEKDENARYQAMDKIRKAIEIHTGRRMFIAEFNNSNDTTFQDIQAVMKIASNL